MRERSRGRQAPFYFVNKSDKGNRKPDDWLGCPFSGLGSRPSGAGYGYSGSGSGSGNLSFVISHRFSHLFRVAGGSPRWRVAGFSIQPSIQPSIQSSTQSSTQSSIQSSLVISVIDSALCHRSSHGFSYVLTRSRPYPRRTRAARGAAPTSRQALPRYSRLHTRYSRHLCPPSALDPALPSPFTPTYPPEVVFALPPGFRGRRRRGRTAQAEHHLHPER